MSWSDMRRFHFKLDKFVPLHWPDLHWPDLHWSGIRRLQEIKLISSMYIWIFVVPIAAKLLSRVEEIAIITIFEYTLSVPLSLPFSWTVFYFSAIFFAFATILHRVRGPRLIHDHPTYASFRDEGKPDWHLRDYAEELGIKYEEFVLQLEEYMAEYDGSVHQGEEYSQTLFWHLYGRADKCRAGILRVTLIFYFLGFCLIGYVMFQNLVWVVRYLLNSTTVS